MMLMLVLIFAVVVIAGISSTQNLKKSDTEKSYDKAISYIDKYMRRIKVDISTSTRGVIVLAKGRSDYGDWLVMVTRVDDVGSGNLKIYGHIFYNISEKKWYFSEGDENYAWGKHKQLGIL